MMFMYFALLSVLLVILILESGDERHIHKSENSANSTEELREIKKMNRNNWNTTTWMNSLAVAIVSGILISMLFSIVNWFRLFMIILIVFILVYFSTAWLCSHWHKRIHDKIEVGLNKLDTLRKNT